MKNLLFVIVLIGIIIITRGCSGAPIREGEVTQLIQKSVSEKLGEDIRTSANQSKTYILYMHKDFETANNPAPLLKFILFDKRKGKILLEESVPAGTVKWISETQIEVTWFPGMVSTENPSKVPGYIYDVTTEKKSELLDPGIIQHN